MSAVKKRSIVIAGHKTSISLEEPFFEGLKGMAARQKRTLSDLTAEIDQRRLGEGNLSSAIRVAVLADLQARVPA